MKNNTFIIAEAGVNHNGSLKLAFALVDAAVESGADAVKFQTFISEKAVSTFAEKADYQKNTTKKNESQLEMIKKLELSFEEFEKLAAYCKKKEILFLSTAFDLESLRFLDEKLNVPLFKIPSGEITNGPLMLNAAKTQKDIILSTGMSTIVDIENALAIINYGYLYPHKTPSKLEEIHDLYQGTDCKLIQKKVTILHCTTEYPAPFDELNLRVMQTLTEKFQTKAGFSDHSRGILAPIAAVAMGAKVIEKHFTLNKNMEGPDHQASLEPDELKEMVQNIRIVEQFLGSSEKQRTDSEMKNLIIARKSLVANVPISRGEVFTEENIAIKRPGNGISPLKYWDVLGKKANKDFERDELL